MSKIKVNSVFMATIISFPLNLFAFHTVSEILPEKKLLICKDVNQLIQGNKVEVFKIDQTKRSGMKLGLQKGEFDLPLKGTKLDLYHREFHDSGKRKTKYHDLKLGSGTVIDYDLSGKEISSLEVSDKKNSFTSIKKAKISDEDARKLQKDCIVIQAEEQVKIKDVTTVIF